MKFLNLGCGFHYSNLPEWTNIDFVSSGKRVISHNLLDGIPFNDETFDLVYHSHVLEHFSKEDGKNFIMECFRVLKPAGIIRIAVPDLEKIVRNYLKFLEFGLSNPDDKMERANYEWMLLEMYDQTVRNFSGGDMGKYLFQETIINEKFVFDRLGEEAKGIRNKFLYSKSNNNSTKNLVDSKTQKKLLPILKLKIKAYLLQRWNIDENALAVGKFRKGGEIHQWMYDRYSLTNLLKQADGKNIQITNAFTSFINNWSSYNIDGKDGVTRKPDSLFIEAVK